MLEYFACRKPALYVDHSETDTVVLETADMMSITLMKLKHRALRILKYPSKCKNKINNDSSDSDDNNNNNNNNDNTNNDNNNSDNNNNNNINDDTDNKESKSSVVIPYKGGTSETLRRILIKAGIRVAAIQTHKVN
ncbi:unnamed protein product [Trichobilharzia regenti]|nr:unnamed protein product [Trichobilharzia regenti]